MRGGRRSGSGSHMVVDQQKTKKKPMKGALRRIDASAWLNKIGRNRIPTMWMISTESSDDTETLCCHVCRTPFPALELAWMAWPVIERRGVSVPTVWAHRKCLEGQAVLIF